MPILSNKFQIKSFFIMDSQFSASANELIVCKGTNKIIAVMVHRQNTEGPDGYKTMSEIAVKIIFNRKSANLIVGRVYK